MENFEDMCNRLDTIPARDGQTDRQADGQTSYHGIVRAIHTSRAVKISSTRAFYKWAGECTSVWRVCLVNALLLLFVSNYFLTAEKRQWCHKLQRNRRTLCIIWKRTKRHQKLSTVQ